MTILARVLCLAALPLVWVEAARAQNPAVILEGRVDVNGKVGIQALSSRAGLDLTPALAEVLHCQGKIIISQEGVPGEFRCLNPIPRDGLSFEAIFDLAPIARKLAPTDEIQLGLGYPRLGFETSSTPLDDRGPRSRVFQSARFAADAVPGPIHIQFGYRRDQLVPIYLPLAAMALVLILIAMNLSRAGLAELNLSALLLGTLFWLGVATYLNAAGPLRILLSGTPLAEFAAVLLEYFPPPICVAAGSAWGARNLLGRTRGAIFAEVFWGFGMFFFPLASALAAIPLMVEQSWIAAAPWFVLSPVSLFVCRWRLRRNAGSSLRKLTAGELKERVSELAARAGRHNVLVYVSSSTRSQVVNAAALRFNAILLTAPLVQRLARREVDAVAAHEISHLGQDRRTLWTALALAVVFLKTPLKDLLFPNAVALFAALLIFSAIYMAALRACGSGSSRPTTARSSSPEIRER